MKKQKNISAKIARFLSDEMDTNEKEEFSDVTEKNTEMKKEFQASEKAWQKISSGIPKGNSDTGTAWNKLYQRLESEGLTYKPEGKVISLTPILLRIAAAVLLIAVLTLPAYFLIPGLKDSQTKPIVFQAVSNTSAYDLPDGSRVFLKKGSTIKLKEEFESQRSLKLSGEAFFDIMKDPLHPFTIHTRNASIRVLGTSFNVRESSSSHRTEVLVESGRVKVQSSRSPASLILNPGDFAHINNKNAGKITSPDPNYMSWKTREFEFKNTSLTEVFRVLEEAYQVKIIYSGHEIEKLKLTSSYSGQSADAIMETIATAFRLDMNKNRNTYRISRDYKNPR